MFFIKLSFLPGTPFPGSNCLLCAFQEIFRIFQRRNYKSQLVYTWVLMGVFFSYKLEFFGKTCAKFVKPWEMKRLPWDREHNSETVTHVETVRVVRSDIKM